jgi:hypothetical protein
MPDRPLGVRRRGPGARDAHGEPTGGAHGPLFGPWPGAAREGADGSWSLRVDPQAWPVTAGDLVVNPDTGDSWLVRSAALLRNNLDSTVDYVRVDAMERIDATSTEVPINPPPTTHA